MATPSMFVFILLLLATGTPGLYAGIRVYKGLWRPLYAHHGNLGPKLVLMGTGLLLGAVAAALAVIGDLFTWSAAPEGAWWQWVSTAIAVLGVALFFTPVLLYFGPLPVRLRPTWIRELQGSSPARYPDGAPAQLPVWTSMRREDTGPDQNEGNGQGARYIQSAGQGGSDSDSGSPLGTENSCRAVHCWTLPP